MRYQIKNIPGYPGYRIDTNGQVFSCQTNHGAVSNLWHKLKPGGTKYLGVEFAGGTYRTIHSLVLETFIGPRPLKMQACHNNGIKTDNRLENLRWDTCKNNYLDAVRHGTRGPGESAPSPKLSEQDVLMIWELLHHSRLTHRRIGDIFGVHFTNISRIKRRKSWKYLNLRSF